jgi:hypothetical protein
MATVYPLCPPHFRQSHDDNASPYPHGIISEKSGIEVVWQQRIGGLKCVKREGSVRQSKALSLRKEVSPKKKRIV